MEIFGKFEKKVKKVIADLIADSTLGASVVYKSFQSQTRDATTGQIVPTFTNYSIRAVKLNHTQSSQMQWIASVEVGDLVFIFKPEELPTLLSMKDRVAYAGRDLAPKSIDEIFGIATCITVAGGQ